jgi:hypothetical protein
VIRWKFEIKIVDRSSEMSPEVLGATLKNKAKDPVCQIKILQDKEFELSNFTTLMNVNCQILQMKLSSGSARSIISDGLWPGNPPETAGRGGNQEMYAA